MIVSKEYAGKDGNRFASISSEFIAPKDGASAQEVTKLYGAETLGCMTRIVRYNDALFAERFCNARMWTRVLPR